MTDFLADYEKLVDKMPRSMPDGWGLDLVTEAPDKFNARWRQDGNGTTISLGFWKTPETLANLDRYLLALRSSLWQAAELVRLGRLDMLEGIID